MVKTLDCVSSGLIYIVLHGLVHTLTFGDLTSSQTSLTPAKTNTVWPPARKRKSTGSARGKQTTGFTIDAQKSNIRTKADGYDENYGWTDKSLLSVHDYAKYDNTAKLDRCPPLLQNKANNQPH